MRERVQQVLERQVGMATRRRFPVRHGEHNLESLAEQ
jgi:hypothetical protein